MRIFGILFREINEGHFKIFARSFGKIRMSHIQITVINQIKCQFPVCQFLSIILFHYTPPHSKREKIVSINQIFYADYPNKNPNNFLLIFFDDFTILYFGYFLLRHYKSYLTLLTTADYNSIYTYILLKYRNNAFFYQNKTIY